MQTIARSDFCDPCPHSLPLGAIMFRVVFCLLLLLGGALPPPRRIPSLCGPPAIRHQQGILLVQDRLSSRYSLSGGIYIDRGEPRAGGPRAVRRRDRPAGSRHRQLGPLAAGQGVACRTLDPCGSSGGRVCLPAPGPGSRWWILNARLIAAADLPPDQPVASRRSSGLDSPETGRGAREPGAVGDSFSDAASALHRAELQDPAPANGGWGPDALWPGRVILGSAFPAGAAALLPPAQLVQAAPPLFAWCCSPWW